MSNIIMEALRELRTGKPMNEALEFTDDDFAAMRAYIKHNREDLNVPNALQLSDKELDKIALEFWKKELTDEYRDLRRQGAYHEEAMSEIMSEFYNALYMAHDWDDVDESCHGKSCGIKKNRLNEDLPKDEDKKRKIIWFMINNLCEPSGKYHVWTNTDIYSGKKYNHDLIVELGAWSSVGRLDVPLKDNEKQYLEHLMETLNEYEFIKVTKPQTRPYEGDEGDIDYPEYINAEINVDEPYEDFWRNFYVDVDLEAFKNWTEISDKIKNKILS